MKLRDSPDNAAEETQTAPPEDARHRVHPSHHRHVVGLPRSVRLMLAVHLACVALCAAAAAGAAASSGCGEMPRTLASKCTCDDDDGEGRGGLVLVCGGVDSSAELAAAAAEANTAPVDGEKGTWNPLSVTSLTVRDSNLTSFDLSHLSPYSNLVALSLTRAGIRKLTGEPPRLPRLEHLDLSSNRLTGGIGPGLLTGLSSPVLSTLDLSGNYLKELKPAFGQLSGLTRLDLSSNTLDEGVDPRVFKQLPKTLQHLDISNNSWTCSPKLSWMHDWSKSLVAADVLRNLDDTRCRYDNTNQHGPLLLLMEYYVLHVLPSCPYADGCTCLLTKVQEGPLRDGAAERVYSVGVECADRALTHFPKVPRHTRAVDLTGNRLDARSFAQLKVMSHHYDEVESLVLDGNRLGALPEALLDMRLNRVFSARDNQLATIPYDFSQRLLLQTVEIRLAGNPWSCTCGSQITDLNLIAKIRDKKEMTCGQGSVVELVGTRIDKISPQVLCPPESNGELQEVLLQVLCVVLAVLIVLLLARLAYDYRQYKNRGQLPWIALRMP